VLLAPLNGTGLDPARKGRTAETPRSRSRSRSRSPLLLLLLRHRHEVLWPTAPVRSAAAPCATSTAGPSPAVDPPAARTSAASLHPGAEGFEVTSSDLRHCGPGCGGKVWGEGVGGTSSDLGDVFRPASMWVRSRGRAMRPRVSVSASCL